MANVDYYRSRPGPLQLLGEGLASGAGSALGQQLGKGLGSLVGAGFEKLSNKGSSEGNIEFWVNQGFTPEEAAQLVQMPLQIQQQMLRQSGDRKRTEALAPAYAKLLGAEMPSKKESMAESQEKTPEEAENDLILKLLESGATEKDFKDLLQAQQAQKKISLAEEKGEIARHSATAPQMKEYTEDYKTAQDGLHRIKRMKEIDKEGVTGQGRMRLVEAFEGIPWGLGKPFAAAFQGFFPLDPASQEFQKLSQEFLREIKSIFGARISNLEVENYMKSIPTLINTAEGRERVYKNFEYMYQAKKLPYKIAKEIKKERGGKTPLHIDELVTDRIGKRKKQLAKKIDFSAPKEEQSEDLSPKASATQTPRERVERTSRSMLPYQGSVRTTIEDLFG